MTDQLPFDWQFPYTSQRMPVLARNAFSHGHALRHRLRIACRRAIGPQRLQRHMVCAVVR